MPIVFYHRDDMQRRIVAIGAGLFSADDILGIFERMRAEGTWTYGALYDVRRMVGRPSLSDLKRLRDGAGQLGPGGEQAGPMAVVAVVATDQLYSRACAYAAMGPPGRFDVFADRGEAEAWLVMHTPRSPL
jgi:hypothetical protein